ncbi:hypothetical protein [Nonomuraea jiangxiensis]|uniref:Uncharacterized protein n=1 Tax=Nonomuraea jiangxiensis TaxID=633440 RepID=A0A1G9N6R5_9ACTN|nr:hypothetical protein [Nonomuraea jiangxiensis]SDL82094.1 hypothetical protein SAMN05421869_13152 [Nonomuraea jiangxiensis]
MTEDRDTAVRTDFSGVSPTSLPGDTHWYDLPDDDLDPELDEPASAPRRPRWRWWSS